MNRNSKRFMLMSVATGVVLGGFMIVSLLAAVAPKVYAQDTEVAAPAAAPESNSALWTDKSVGMALLSASIVMCVSCIAAGVAVGMTGSAAIGAVAERPELMGRTILIVGLAEGIAIYGLIVAIMILGKLPG